MGRDVENALDILEETLVSDGLGEDRVEFSFESLPNARMLAS